MFIVPSAGIGISEPGAEKGDTFDYLNDHNMIIVGDPDTCARQLKIYKDMGVDLVLGMMQMYKIPHKKVMESVRLFGQHVIPQWQ